MIHRGWKIVAVSSQTRVPIGSESWGANLMGAGLMRSGPFEDGRNRLGQNLQIQRKRPMINIFQVLLDPLIKRRQITASINLPKAGNTRFHTEAPIERVFLKAFDIP